ncbi:hypothetical protein V6N11_079515 [Hibiscus sabdariffa]|uniref:Reverse transcriptase/retrotransposon-derived protein RNase H-like domain-containing protein n=1 Tax=Hibiscus sabdariffa TaxID=183260 RepID=A0ABR2RVL2_9ROSI
MADQTIRELAVAPAVQQPLCITFPQGDTPFQLKTGLIHLLPTFHGLSSESPHKHLFEFHLVCSSMKPQGVSEDQIKLCAFPFSLSGIDKEWLFYLPPNSITTWTDLNSKFLDRLSEQTLIQYFYEGLLPMEMKMIEAASGGAIFNMMPTQAKELISTMAANSQQFGAISEPNRRVHEEETTQPKPCEICTMIDHPTDCCPTLQEETVNAVGKFPGSTQRPYNPHEGVLENVLVKVNELIFPVDFYVIDMENDRTNTSPEILLGRPFLGTADTKIESINFVDIFEPAINEFVEANFVESCRDYDDSDDAPQVELKELPTHLKYAFLGDNNTLPVIVSNKLSKREEDDLVEVLRIHKEAIGWTIADIKGLSPSTCMHKIKVEEDAKPSPKGQRRLNPPMMEVSSKYRWHLKIKRKRRSHALSEHSPIDACPSDYDFSKIAQPLCNLLQKDQIFNFNSDCKESWDTLKEKLVSAPIVQPPNWDHPFELMCDASDTTVGAVLGQKIGKEPHVIAYASRTLDSAQKNYSTTKKELLAIVFALEKFRSNLLEFNLEIKDKKGRENLVADHLSQIPISSSDPPIKEEFLDEHLMVTHKGKMSWFADMMNYLVTGKVPTHLPRSTINRIKKDSRFYVWDDPYLWKHCFDQVIRRCIAEDEVWYTKGDH